ncbi:MAG: DUF5698 domain-containing protein [Tepidisphaeraceae bacterium]
MLESLPGALLIFALRVTDVSVGTIRTIYMIRGKRFTAACLGFVESGVFILAVSSVLSAGTQHPTKMIGYALGYATGTLLGVTLDGLIASGQVMIRIITDQGEAVVNALRDRGLGATLMRGEGKDGPVAIIWCVSQRRLTRQTLKLVDSVDADAFVTVDPVGKAIGGHLAEAGLFSSFGK